MRRLISFSVRRPVAVAMLYGAVALLAVAAWSNLAVEVQPGGEYPRVTVTTAWPGASPESIQALVTSRIEAVAAAVPGVRHLRSTTRRGTSEVRIELSEEIDLDLAVFELSDRLALLSRELPPAAGRPEVRPYVPNRFRELQGGRFFSFSLRGPRGLDSLRALAKRRILDELSTVDGVGEVEVSGGADPHLLVDIDPGRAELFGIRTYEVARAVREMDEGRPVGRVVADATAYTVRLSHRLDDLTPLRELPLATRGKTLVRLRDVAEIRTAWDPVPSYSRVDGEPVVEVSVTRRSGTDLLRVARAVRARLDEIEGRLPPDLTVEVIDDEAADLEDELALLRRRLLLILAVVAVLLVVLMRDLRTPLVLYGAVGAALALTIVALDAFRIPVNVLTLTGLALAFGMLVDNAVVVLENVVRHRAQGAAPAEAADEGTSEVIVPLLAATATTVGVFLPFALFQGRLRDYYLPMALAVAIALTASLIIAVTLMPAGAGRGWLRRSPRLPGRAGGAYRRSLRWGLRHPWIVLLAVGLAGYGSWLLFEEVPRGGFGGWWGRDRLSVWVELPRGAETSRTDAAIRPFEEYALGLEGVERVTVRVAGERGFLRVLFTDETEATGYPLFVKEQMISMATRYAGVQIGVYGFDRNSYYSGAGGGDRLPWGIKLLGSNYRRLGEIAREVTATAARHPRVQRTAVTAGGYGWDPRGTDLVLRIRRDRLAAHGMRGEELILQLQTLLAGRTSRERIRVGGEAWEVRVKEGGHERRTVEELLESPLRAAGGTSARLSDVVELRMEPVPGVITREDQRYERWARWEFRGSGRAGANYHRAILDSLELPPGTSASTDEAFYLSREERLQIRRVAVVAVLVVFMVLASLYESLLQPLIVMLSVPFALVGVALAFWLAGEAFDASAAVGVVLLAGIVVNNAILMVDHVNLRRDGGLEPTEAIVTGAAERARPILITSITTVGGLLPLVFVGGEETAGRHDVWSNLALATVGGLTAATLLTLTLTPVLYSLVERGRSAGARLARRIGRIWRSVPVPGSPR